MAGRLGDPEVVHRCITEGQLDVHPTLNAIVVHYRMDAMVMNDYGELMVADTKECKKLIKVQNLDSRTDVQRLAQLIVPKCDLIQSNRLPEVEQLLTYLRTRNKTSNKGKLDITVLEDSSRKIQEQINDMQSPTEEATMSELESYLEYLYEDLQSKIRGTGMILQLSRSPDNLMDLIGDESLILALARVLKEDWKKSIELATNIVYIFFCFSTFSVFHKILGQNKIGSTCMMVIEHELKRYQTLQDDLSEKKEACKSADASVATKAKREYDKGKKKYHQILQKQETLLRVTLYLLLNLSEDKRVEFKMRNKGLITSLISFLDRSNQDLLILVISFLKKLSIYVENKDDMSKAGVLKKLFNLIPSKNNEILENITLRLILNLSFDPKLRQEMVKLGFLPKLSELLTNGNHRVVVLCILYHISIDKKARHMFSYTNIIFQLMQIILENPDNLVDPETIALAINLASSPRNVQLMCEGSGLKLLMKRALKSQDSLLFKMIRNISNCPGSTKKLFLPFLFDLCHLLTADHVSEDVCVEILGILGNLALPEVDFHKVVVDLQLLPYILLKLEDYGTQDDLLLDVIVLCGTLALDEKCAALLVSADVPQLLINILKAKQEDDEIVLQIVYLLHQLVLHKSTREQVTKQSLAPDYLLELMNDTNKEICKLCSKTLDIILECDPELAHKIKQERFRWHNFQWLEIMTDDAMYNTDEVDDDYISNNYSFLHTAADIFDLQNHLDDSFSYPEGDFDLYDDKRCDEPGLLYTTQEDPYTHYESTSPSSPNQNRASIREPSTSLDSNQQQPSVSPSLGRKSNKQSSIKKNSVKLNSISGQTKTNVQNTVSASGHSQELLGIGTGSPSSSSQDLLLGGLSPSMSRTRLQSQEMLGSVVSGRGHTQELPGGLSTLGSPTKQRGGSSQDILGSLGSSGSGRQDLNKGQTRQDNIIKKQRSPSSPRAPLNPITKK